MIWYIYFNMHVIMITESDSNENINIIPVKIIVKK
jgi:hypothetical protein